MAQERITSSNEEEKSAWKSRLFKVGAVVAIVGAVVGSSLMMAVGVISMGGSWALGRGK